LAMWSSYDPSQKFECSKKKFKCSSVLGSIYSWVVSSDMISKNRHFRHNKDWTPTVKRQ
jgi:hypothetical protein